MIEPMTFLLAALAGGVGAVFRYGVVTFFAARAPRFPVGVLLVNVLGSAIGGALIGGLGAGAFGLPGDVAQLILLTGFCGGLTTFSTFTVDTVQLAERDENLVQANLNVLLNLVLGIGAAVLAFLIAGVIVG